MDLQKIFLTLGYSGLSKKAPGTVGSFIALLIGLLLLKFLHPSTLFLLAILISIIAIKEIDKYEEKIKKHDSKEIVIDELAGMWITLSMCNINSENYIIIGILAFVYFRLFDIFKPSLIGKIDRDVKGGLGVMGDDLLAGICAGISTVATYYLYISYLNY